MHPVAGGAVENTGSALASRRGNTRHVSCSGGSEWPEAWQRLALQLAASVHAIMQQRYEELEIRDALNRRSDYAEACKELAAVIRGAYSRLPKVVQAAIYDDALVAFRLSPGLDTAKQLSAANTLLQAVESALPKQRRNAAASEYKHWAVAQSRNSKGHQQEVSEYTPLPYDLLVHVFGFLDSSGLAAAGAVCRCWRVASVDETLWRSIYLSTYLVSDKESSCLEVTRRHSWRRAFEAARKARPYSVFLSNRAYCVSCNCLVWMRQVPWRMQGRRSGCNKRAGYHEQSKLRPMTADQVVKYMVKEKHSTSPSASSDDSDSDEEREDQEHHRFFRLWAHPKLGDECCE